MKGKILLMAILSASALLGCGEIQYKTERGIFFKNTTDREIDYAYSTRGIIGYQFEAQGKKIDYAAATLLPGEEKEAYGVAIYRPDGADFWNFYFMLRIPYEGEQKWLCVYMYTSTQTRVVEITEELIQKIENETKTYTDLPDVPFSYIGKNEITDKTSPLANSGWDMGEVAYLPYWDSWSSESEFPVQEAKEASSNRENNQMEYYQNAGITEFSYIYQDIVYSMSLQDGKRTRIGEITEDEKNQGVK